MSEREAARQRARENYKDAEPETHSNDETPHKRFKPGHSLAWFAQQKIDHQKTLLGVRYLCRDGGMFIVAPSGMGKSTLSLQMAMLWCCGLVAFGIKPSKALRILIVQAEDDQGDCTEMAAMINHLKLSDAQTKLVDQNTRLIRCNNLVGWNFIEALRLELQEAKNAGQPFDLVIINPYGVYLGADVKDTEACTQFLNHWLNPLLSDFEIAAILIHHTAKTNFQNTDKYNIWDWAYHGAGAACITNWARAIIAIKPEGDTFNVFRFIAAKRGNRIGEEWENHFEKYFAWSRLPGVLRWEEATGAEIAAVTASNSRIKTVDPEKALEQVPVLDPELKAAVINKIKVACRVGEKLARTALNELIVAGKVSEIPIPNPNGGRSFAGVARCSATV
jgi:hypothetical protein